jgi:5'-nucleotidase
VATNESCIQTTIPGMNDQLRPRTCILHESQDDGDQNKAGNFSIVFTSDMHGRLHNLPRLVSAVKHLRTQQPVLMLDAGDVAFGSAFSTQLGASVVMEAMVMAGYAAITPGNHDVLETFPAGIPLVSVNSHSKLVQKSVVLILQGIEEADRWKVGVVGLSHEEHIDVHAMARLIIDESLCLRKQGVTMVVLLSHGGIAADKHLAQLTRGYVDVVLGGHSHVEVSCKGQWHSDDMVVLHSGYNGESYGIVNVEVNANGLAISTDVVQLHVGLKADVELESWYREKYLSLNLSTEVLYTFDPSVTKRQSCRSMPCETGRLINAAVRQYFKCSSDLVGLFESGSIRGRFLGNITDSDIARVLPWANKMVVLSLRGHTFVEMLRYSNASMETVQ